MSSATITIDKSTNSDPIILNNYIQFTNESIHGLLIIHRLLENANQKVNKFVDLEDQQLNFFSNADLPKDIFEDPEKWFYDVTPHEIFAILEQDKTKDKDPKIAELFRLAVKMKNTCHQVNQIRFDAEAYIKEHDLNDTDQLQGIYDILERAVTLYDAFYESSIQMEFLVNEMVGGQSEEYYTDVITAHGTVKSIIRSLRNKSDANYRGYLSSLKKSIANIEASFDKKEMELRLARHHSEAIVKLIEAHDNAYRFVNTALVPAQYQNYGKFYYYHNSEIINKMNRYGNGYVKEFNQVIKETYPDHLLLLEEPHFYQVVYPKKLQDEESISSTVEKIEAIPDQLLDRTIIDSKHKMVVDSMEFTIRLYDYKIPDGDIVSINYNGDWVLEDYSLEEKPVNLQIKLNPTGKNYLLMHAESIGRRPPNTMAVSYFFEGKRQEIVLQSDLNGSQMIEIEYIDPIQKK